LFSTVKLLFESPVEITVILKSSDKVKSLGRMSTEITSGLRDSTKGFFREQNTEDEIIDASHSLPRGAFGQASVIFAQGNIVAIMQATFDALIGAYLFKQLNWRNFFA
jgi:hypothetical protein